MNWKIHIGRKGQKNLKKFPRKEQNRILNALDELKDNPYAGDIEKISGEKRTWRRRIGNYRFLYDINVDRKSVEVRKIERRTSKTY